MSAVGIATLLAVIPAWRRAPWALLLLANAVFGGALLVLGVLVFLGARGDLRWAGSAIGVVGLITWAVVIPAWLWMRRSGTLSPNGYAIRLTVAIGAAALPWVVVARW